MISEKEYNAYLSALLAGDKHHCQEIVAALLDSGQSSIPEIYVDLFQRSMYATGDLWARNKVSVAVEHLATAITEHLIQSLYPRIFTGENNGLKVVVACVADEYHQLGGRMVADMLELRHWSSYFLGANTPVDALIGLIEQHSVDLAALSLSVYMNYERLFQAVSAIREACAELPIIVGGQAFGYGGRDIEKAFPAIRYIPDIEALHAYAAAME